MEEDLLIPHDSAKNGDISVREGEKEKVKDLGTDGSLSNADDTSIKEHGSSTKKLSLNKTHCKTAQGAAFSGKILSFECSVCKDDCTYSPNDLLKHFQVAHKGDLPTYPCELCGFMAKEFSALQRHRIEHRNTLVTCELCNDDVQYSLLLITRHYVLCHSLNGQFSCDWCDFTTVDAGTFVQHIHHHTESPWKCSRCRHISLNEDDHQKHLKAHSGMFPFICQVCGFGAARSEYLKKHVVSVHKERRNVLKALEDGSSAPANSSSSLKLCRKKSGEFQESPRISKLNSLSVTLPNQNGRVIKPEMSLEEIHQFVEGSATKREKLWSKVSPSSEQSLPVMLQECDMSSGADAATHTSPNGLTVLMIKNKISLPPNCTTKVMGFKLVDGKKHLVLKVIPAVKQAELEDADKHRVSENGDGSEGRTCFSVSPRAASCTQMDQDDIMAVKVKIEEEETSVCTLDSSPLREDDAGGTSPCVNRPTTDTLRPTTDELHLTDELQNQSCEAMSGRDSRISSSSAACSGGSSPSEMQPLKHGSKKTVTEDCGATDGSSETLASQLLLNSSSNALEHTDQSCPDPPEREEPDVTEVSHENQKDPENLSTDPVVEAVSPPPAAVSSLRENSSSMNCTQNSPNIEVFTFHNYSKESFSSSLNTTQNSDSADANVSKASSMSAESPESMKERNRSEEMRNGSDSDAGEPCVADGSSEDENPESVLQDFNIIKVEEEIVPVSKKETRSSLTSVGSFVEEHSDAIISQQLNKERVGASADSSKQTKATLRILQLAEGKQQVLLTTAENRFTLPVQVKASPGFKLITNSSNPQINVSYMKPGQARSSSSAAAPSSRRTSNSSATEKHLSPVKPAASSHYYFNSPAGLKGPMLLSSSSHAAPAEKPAAPTCFLVQRSLPGVQRSLPGVQRSLPGVQRSLPGVQRSPPGVQKPPGLRLAMPLSSSDKASTVQSGRHAFLLRYISPAKTNQEVKTGTQSIQSPENSGNKVFFKIVAPSGSLLSSGAQSCSSQPLFLASRPQAQCILVSSNKTSANASSGVKKLISIQNPAQNEEFCTSPSQSNATLTPSDADKPALAPRPIRPPSQRKRRRKTLFDELPAAVHKARRLSSRAAADRDAAVLWSPVGREVERTLRLAPFSSLQQVKCPRRFQPVVVLNHPDADIPEVSNIMKVVCRHKGAVARVSLSQKTVQALAELEMKDSTKAASAPPREEPRPRPVHSSVRERFLLRLKLRKKSRKKYEVVKSLSGCRREALVFGCWFCGRLFSSQEDWVGHGQRHLMEATRDWNTLF